MLRLNYSLCANRNSVELIRHLFSQELEIKKMAKTGNKEACKVLAKQLVQLRKQKNRTYAVSSKVTSMSTQTKVMNSQMKMAGAMSATAKVRHHSIVFYIQMQHVVAKIVLFWVIAGLKLTAQGWWAYSREIEFGFILLHFCLVNLST